MSSTFQINDAQEWRKRAEDIRCKAETIDHPNTKIIMALIADEYERIADLTSKREVEGLQLAGAFYRRSDNTAAITTAIAGNSASRMLPQCIERFLHFS